MVVCSARKLLRINTRLADDSKAGTTRWSKVSSKARISPMKFAQLAFLSCLALWLFNAKAVFAEGVNYKCLSSNDIQRTLADDEICSDLDITNKNKLSSCLQRKYISEKSKLDSVYESLLQDPVKNRNSSLENTVVNKIYNLPGFSKGKADEINGFVEEKDLDSIGLHGEKRDAFIKEQAEWDESLLYNCMEAANSVENDPYPLMVIKGCLVGMTAERIDYLKNLL